MFSFTYYLIKICDAITLNFESLMVNLYFWGYYLALN